MTHGKGPAPLAGAGPGSRSSTEGRAPVGPPTLLSRALQGAGAPLPGRLRDPRRGQLLVRRPASPSADTSKPIHIPCAAWAGT